MLDPPAELRAACAEVAARARHVSVNAAAIAPYAAALGAAGPPPALAGPATGAAEREAVCAHWLTLDAINFGSGWFPTLRKRPGLSGYRTIAAGLAERFARRGPWTAAELAAIEPGELADVLGQDPAHELIGLFTASLRDLGRRVLAGWGGSFAGLVDTAGGSAVALAAELAGWDCYADVSHYGTLRLPFLKRAQIVSADLQRAGATDFTDLERLTIFADNLVPHVLVLDGVLQISSGLRARIAAGELLPHDSDEEIELRACAVHAGELLVAELSGPGGFSAAQLDGLLWERGGLPRYKASPRPRCRCTAY